MNIDLVPTLTTSNRYLFVFSTDDLDEPLGKRAFARFLLPAERMALQGFPLAYAEFIPEGMHVKASGNAYPVPVVGAVLFPILRQLGNLEPGTLLNWPPEDANSGVVPEMCAEQCMYRKILSTRLKIKDILLTLSQHAFSCTFLSSAPVRTPPPCVYYASKDHKRKRNNTSDVFCKLEAHQGLKKRGLFHQSGDSE